MNYWKPFLKKFTNYRELNYILKNLDNLTPNKNQIFKVFETHPKDIKVIILGENPYVNKDMATGLAFQNGWDKDETKFGNIVKKDVIPLELKIIYEELINDYPEFNGINTWQKQGVFLLNLALTAIRSNPSLHLKYWKKFSESVIRHISNVENNKVWFIWGKNVKSFIPCIKNPYIVEHNKDNIKNIPIFKDRNYVFISASPLEQYWGEDQFFNNNIFFKTNVILEKSGITKINW